MYDVTALRLAITKFVIGFLTKFRDIWAGLFNKAAKDAYDIISESIEKRVHELAVDIKDEAKRTAFIDSLQVKIGAQWHELEARIIEAGHITAEQAEAEFRDWTAKLAELHLAEKVKKTVKKAKKDVKAFIEKVEGLDDK
jgi:hypothetical protein